MTQERDVLLKRVKSVALQFSRRLYWYESVSVVLLKAKI
ncbi:MAG: hypothetical protein ACI9SB_001727 [Candidatus Azotimanducaceae bacterium]|jgi:hypothetical protein